MEVRDVIFCMNGIMDQSKRITSAESIFSIIKVKAFPASLDFSILFLLAGFEQSTECEAVIELIDSSGNVISSISGHIGYQYVDGIEPEFQGMNINTRWNNVIFKDKGKYKARFSADGKILSERSFLVILGD